VIGDFGLIKLRIADCGSRIANSDSEFHFGEALAEVERLDPKPLD
jgi:hypothetical protein